MTDIAKVGAWRTSDPGKLYNIGTEEKLICKTLISFVKELGKIFILIESQSRENFL